MIGSRLWRRIDKQFEIIFTKVRHTFRALESAKMNEL